MTAYNIIYEPHKSTEKIKRVVVVTSNLQIVVKDLQKLGLIKSIQLMDEVIMYD